MPWYRLPDSGCPYYTPNAVSGGVPPAAELIIDERAAIAEWEALQAQRAEERKRALILIDSPEETTPHAPVKGGRKAS
jgi:hypothetical protein